MPSGRTVARTISQELVHNPTAMHEFGGNSPGPKVRSIDDHPLARHRKADPVDRVTAEEALETARPHFPDVGWWLTVRPGLEYREQPTYNDKPPPVPLEEIWVVYGGVESVVDGTVSVVGVSRRTGEVLFHSSFHSGG